MARTKSIFPTIPLPRRAMPWVLFVLGAASIAFGAMTGDVTGLAIGVIATGGALLSWSAEWLLSLQPSDQDEEPDEEE